VNDVLPLVVGQDSDLWTRFPLGERKARRGRRGQLGELSDGGTMKREVEKDSLLRGVL